MCTTAGQNSARGGEAEMLFITTVHITKMCAWGGEDSGGHVL